jgi:DNA helicase HerA-like ATPase
VDAAIRAARTRHAYVLGQPGVGKSSLLLHWILDDLEARRAALVIDPHGALVDRVLRSIPPAARRSVLLVDPGDTDYPFGLDILAAPDEPARDRVVQFFIELFMTLYLPDQQGPMLHQAIRNGLRLLMATGGRLPELPLLFTDRTFLRSRLAHVEDAWITHYFERVWLPWNTDKDGFMAYLTSKLSHFVEDRTLRNILGQAGGLDLERCLARRRLVLVNLSPAKIGRLDARLLGMLLLHQLDQLTHRRTEGTPDVHVYVDEFQELGLPQIADLLATARKFGIGLTLAHQALEQLPHALADAIVQNVGTLVLFRQGPGPGAIDLAAALWPRFQERNLYQLSDFEAIVRSVSPEGRPLISRYHAPAPAALSAVDPRGIRAVSRRAIARPRADVEAELLARINRAPAPGVGP